MLPVGKTNRDDNILFPCEANRANQNAAHVVVFALLIPKLMHLWWQLLELSCLPSFYLLLVSVQTLKENLYGKRSYLCSKQHLKTWTRILCMCQFGCLILLVLLCQWRKIMSHLSWIAERFCSTGSQKEREREEKLESQCYRSIKWLLSAVITAIDITSRQTFPPATRHSRLLSIHLTVRCSCIDIGGVFPVWKSN